MGGMEWFCNNGYFDKVSVSYAELCRDYMHSSRKGRIPVPQLIEDLKELIEKEKQDDQ